MDNTVDLVVGKRLRQARETAGLTHEQLAEKIGLAPRDLWLIEAGQERLHTKKLFAACAALKIDVFDVFPHPDWFDQDEDKNIVAVLPADQER